MPTPKLLLALITAACFSSALFAVSDDSIVAEVIAADHARGSALLAADTKALDKILAADLRYTHSTGKLETKAIHIGTLTDGLRYERFVTSNLHGHVVTPDVVGLTGKIDQRKGTPGKWTDNNLLFQAVWRHNTGTWQLVSLQTAAPPAVH